MVARAKDISKALLPFRFSSKVEVTDQVMWSRDINKAKSIALKYGIRANAKIKKYTLSQVISLALAEKSRVIYCPLNVQGLLSKYRKANEICMQKENRQLTVEEFCFDNELDDKVIKSLNSVLVPAVSLSQMVEESGITFEEIIPSEDEFHNNLEYESFSHDIELGLSSLNSREKDIIVKSFGLGCPEQSLDEIAFIMNLSRERVRQIRIKALNKLKRSESIGHLKSYL